MSKFEVVSKYTDAGLHLPVRATANAAGYDFEVAEDGSAKFKFKKDTVHEDFGLTPLIVIKASKVNSINYIGYNYYRRNGSIMNIPDYNWTKRKVKDLFNHYLYLDKEIDKIDIKKDIFKSYIANNTIMKICELKGKDYKEYKKKLKEEKVYDNLLTDTTARKVKKIMYKISPKLTIKFIK